MIYLAAVLPVMTEFMFRVRLAHQFQDSCRRFLDDESCGLCRQDQFRAMEFPLVSFHYGWKYGGDVICVDVELIAAAVKYYEVWHIIWFYCFSFVIHNLLLP